MTTQDAMRMMRERGYEVTEPQLRSMIRRGTISKPQLDSSLRFAWTDADIAAACSVLESRTKAVAD